MKKLFLSVLASVSFIFAGCSFESDSGSSSNLATLIAAMGGISLNSSASGPVSMTNTATWNYTSSNDMFIVDEDVKTLTINGDLNGKKIYYVPVNTSGTDIPANYVKYISNGTAIASGSSYIADDISPIEVDADIAEDASTGFSGNQFSHYIGYNFKPDPKSISSKNILRSIASNYSQITSYTDGSTTKSFYVSLDESDNYYSRTATLRAHNDVCNVWVLDDYYNNTSSGTNVNTAKAQTIADAFESFYAIETNIFGAESNYVYSGYTNGSFNLSSMATVSDTSTKINIVIYDLFEDANNGGTLGFFSPRDYYSNSLLNAMGYASSSNYGKYFYIDSYYANQSEGTIISTLAHEFQHMIHFGQKSMNDLDSDTSFNEMLSMLCEDMLQDLLGISDEDSPRGRLLQFMYRYPYCGIRDYDNTSLSYATSYAFGSWLCRQYGGAALVKEMMSNGKVNNDCIVSAVNSLNSTSYTFNDLFGQFIKACYGNNTTYTFNQNAAQTITYTNGSTTYNYPMTAINLWESGSSLYDFSQISVTTTSGTMSLKNYIKSLYTTSNGTLLLATDVYNYLGPVIFRNGTLFSKLYPTYGMWLEYFASVTSSTSSVTLTFTSTSSSTMSGLKTYVYIK